MNNEIKEILDIMKKCYDLKDENFDNYITLYQLGLLLDYITNLQQAFERSYTEEQVDFAVNEVKEQLKIEKQYTNQLCNEIDKLRIKNYELQQENERLKERVAYLERSNNRREDTIIDLRFEVAEQEDYKSRCEKAIPILNNIYMLDNVTITNNACEEIDKTINILQNGSDDNE